MVTTGNIFVDTRNIVERAEALGRVKTFLRALKRAGLEGRLRETGPYTVFAPDDRAFALPPAGLASDLMNDRERMGSLLRYHIVPQRIVSRDVRGVRDVLTLSGKTLMCRSHPWFTVNNLIVTQPDIECINGVIHVIGSLLVK